VLKEHESSKRMAALLRRARPIYLPRAYPFVREKNIPWQRYEIASWRNRYMMRESVLDGGSIGLLGGVKQNVWRGNKKGLRELATLWKYWLLDLGSNQGPTD